MKLPIDRVLDSNPPLFRWKQVVDTPLGKKVVECMGALPPSVEAAVAALIEFTRQQAQEIVGLRRINEGFAERIAAQSEAQSEVLSKRAEKPEAPVQQVSLSKRGRGNS